MIAKKDRPVEPFLDAAQDGVFRAAALTNRLLSFARKGATEIVEVDVNGHIQGLSDLLGRALNGKVKLKVQLGLVTMPAHCDPGGLENALLNLAVNARDAMPDGGRVTISTAERTLDADAAAPIGVDPGEYVEVSVSDEGTGIPPEMLAKIFEPFFSTNGAKGTGLGRLAQIVTFARGVGGGICVDFAVGVGTTFRLLLPCTARVDRPLDELRAVDAVARVAA